MAADRENKIERKTNKTSHMAFRLSYIHLTLANSKDQGQGRGDFNCEYLANGKR